MSRRIEGLVCATPGCYEVAHSGRAMCRDHDRRKREGASSTARGYDSQWRRRAKRFLASHPICAVPGCRVPATVADHVIPRRELIAQGVADPDSDDRLQALCAPHHGVKTVTYDGGYGNPKRRPA
jgi:5-methylcytosine-specific restriction enzyme A